MLTSRRIAQNVLPPLDLSVSVAFNRTDVQKQNRFASDQTPCEKPVEIDPYPESTLQWLVEVLNLLTHIVDRNPDVSCAVVTEKDYKQLSAVLEDLIYGVGEDESHPLWSSMAFIGELIRRYEDEHFPKLTNLFPELKENSAIEAAAPNRKSTVTIPTWTESEIAAHAFFSIGGLFSEVKLYEEAVSAYDMVLRLKPDFAEAYYNRGTAKTFIAEYAAAIADFDEAICLKPELVEAYYNRGLTKSTLNQPKAAEHDLRTALKLAKQQRYDNIKVNIKQRLKEFNDTE